MRILLVSPFAPHRDGIATYATQELRRLRLEGNTVEVCSPQPSAARWHLPLGGPAGMSKLVAMAGDHDRIVLQFGPDLAFGRCRSSAQRVAVWMGLVALARRRPLELRVHEVEYGPLDQNPLERRAARLALAAADRVTVHTAAERDALDRRLGIGHRLDIVDHGRDFRPAVRLTREDARRRLGLPVDGYRFVAIGFLQRHKGFDLAVEAIDRLPGRNDGSAGGAHLHVVGSARVDHPEIATYVADLAARCGRTADATLHEGYVSDVDFDRWLQAADAVVLPYREIWSSGVLERARLFRVPVVASDLPQLRDQAPPDTLFFDDVDELVVIMDKLRSSASGDAGVRNGSPAEGDGPGEATIAGRRAEPWTVDPGAPDRADLQRQIAERARTTVIGGAGVEPDDRDRRAVDGLLALGPPPRVEPVSARPGVAPVKRAIARLTNWRIDPVAERLEALQRATTEAVARLEARTETVKQFDESAPDRVVDRVEE
ncbi:MAG: glycosyltransferase family 4 protein [Actinomycetota bacterium]